MYVLRVIVSEGTCLRGLYSVTIIILWVLNTNVLPTLAMSHVHPAVMSACHLGGQLGLNFTRMCVSKSEGQVLIRPQASEMSEMIFLKIGVK